MSSLDQHARPIGCHQRVTTATRLGESHLRAPWPQGKVWKTLCRVPGWSPRRSPSLEALTFIIVTCTGERHCNLSTRRHSQLTECVREWKRGTRGLAVKPYPARSSPAHTFKGAHKFIPAARVVSTSVNKRQLYINCATFRSLDNSELLFNTKALPALFIPEPSSAYQTHTVITPRLNLHLLFFIFLCHPFRGRESWMRKFTHPRLALDTVIGG